MKLKTSLFKKGLIISDLKRFWWVSALYAILLLFTIPINHYIQKLNSPNLNTEWLKESISRDLLFRGGANQVFLLVVPIVIGALVFRYMQKGRSASLYHSLPLTRAVLYFNSVMSAVILLVSPLLLMTLIMFLLNWFSYLSVYYSSVLIFSWLLYSLLFGIMFLAMSIFVGMFTGNSIAQLAFVYILNFLPMFLVEFVRMNIREILFGFDTYSNVNFYAKMPMAMLLNIGTQINPVKLIIVYITVTIALFVGGLYAFKLRKPETAGDIITFRPFRPVFIYGVTVCATLLGGAYFLSIGGSYFQANGKTTLPLAMFGYFISSLISYVIVQMITNRSFKVLYTYKGYIGFALVLFILTLGVKFDVIGYVNKIPAPSDVEEAFVGYNLQWWENKDNPDFDSIKYGNEDTAVYTAPQNVENVTRLHKLILDNKSMNGNSQYVAYKLKNGKRIVRRYSIDTDLYASVLGPLYESKEYKEDRYPILTQNVNSLKYIEIRDNRSVKNPLIISDKAKLESFKVAIRKDISNLAYKELVSNSQSALSINIIDTKDTKDTNGTNIYYAISSVYTNTIDWLKKEGIYEEVILKPDYIDSVILESFNYNNIDNNFGKETRAVEPKRVEITDKSIIKELLDLSFDVDYKNRAINYTVSFSHGNNSTFYRFELSFEDKVSPELQSYVDKIK